MTDCTTIIKNILNELKTIQFQCSRMLVSSENNSENLITTEPGDGRKASALQIEIPANCSITYSVDVKNRKLPLKISLQYDESQVDADQDFKADLIVYASMSVASPSESNCSQIFINPKSSILINKNYPEFLANNP